MRRITFIAIITLLGFLGAFLAAGFGVDDRELWWIGSHIKVIREQLVDLADHLRLYREAHGRYPTNDEGLSALDNFDARIEVHLYHDPARPQSAPGFRPGGGLSRYGWTRAQANIAAWRAEHGSVPADIEQLSAAVHLGFDWLPPEVENETGARRAQVAITRGNNLFVITEAGVMTPWMLPYVYENRAGLDPAKFQGSPADTDRARRYSVRVADGVYVYSVGAQCYAADYDRWWWGINGVRLLGAAMIPGAIVMIVRAVRASRKAPVVLFVVAAGLGLVAHGMNHATCYVMSNIFGQRDRGMIARQRELLESCHARGILNDATYRKVLSSLPPDADE